MKVALAGGAYQAHSVIASAQRSLNLYSEPMPEGQHEPMPAANYPTPGTVLLKTIGTGPIRGIRQCTTGGIYVVSGSTVYSVNPTTWEGTALGTITPGLKTPVSMQDNGLDMLIVDGTAKGWVVNLASNAFAQIPLTATQTPVGASGTAAITAGTALYTPFTPTVTGQITGATVALGAGYTGKLQAAIFNSTGVGPGASLGIANVVTNPAAGAIALTFGGAVEVTAGTQYWLGVDSDTSAGTWSVQTSGGGVQSSTPFASFPANYPAVTGAAAVVVTVTESNDPSGMFSGADRVDYLDTYFILNKPGTPQFYISGSLAVTFDPLDFANKESYSDELVTLVVARRELYLLGNRATEIWYDAGATDTAAGSFPFAEVQGVFIDHGIVAKYSIGQYDNSIYWLTRDRQGQGIVLTAAGYETKRVSTYAIEAELRTYPRIDDAIGWCYQIAGHTFYVLTFPHADHTWVYDITTGLWHEWAWIDANGTEHRHRANAFWPCNDTLVVGDWQNGNLYALDNTVFTDDGQPIKRVRSFPHSVADGKRVFYRQFIADFDTGNTPTSTVTTRTEKIITWLPNIAQLTGVSVGAITVDVGGAFIDWERGLIYMVGQTGYQKYTTALETQSPLVTVATPGTRFVFAGDIDPLSGDLILQASDPPTTFLMNAQPILKLDPNTFAVLGTFGVATSFPSYPASVWLGEGIVCVVCNGVSFGFLKYSEFSGAVAGFRVDTMQHSGFIADIVSGSTDNRGLIIAGKTGGTSASVFLSWSATTVPKPAVPLYRIDVAASATAYDPASWPTPNPGITWTTVGTVPVAAVDPTWTGFTVYSLGYDQADGNVLMLAGTTDSSQGYRVLKLNSTTAAVMWNIATGTVIIDLGTSRINGSLWMIRNPGAGAGPTTSYRINTLTGSMETLPITGFFAGANEQVQQSDSDTSQMFYGGTFTAQTGAANPVTGTSTFTNAWAWMGGQTVRTIVTNAERHDHLISLTWSDDRGHSWSYPVSQDIGSVGEYRTSLQWQRLGMARDRVFRLSWSVPMATALQGCWFDATPAQS
jgi:hypothetical protein